MLSFHYKHKHLIEDEVILRNMTRKRIGSFSSKIIDALELDISPGTPIYISDSNIEHMKSSHPLDFQKYGHDLENIIANPDYVGKNAKDNSIEFTKEYVVDSNFISKGTLKKLDN